MAARAKTISLCGAAQTTALEFTDGKVMLGQMRSLDEITYERICEVMGEAEFHAELAAAQLVALVKWTDLPDHSLKFYQNGISMMDANWRRDI